MKYSLGSQERRQHALLVQDQTVVHLVVTAHHTVLSFYQTVRQIHGVVLKLVNKEAPTKDAK